MLSQELLDILACPACKGPVVQSEGATGVICSPCGLKFPIREGIPVMLTEEAEQIAARAAAHGGS